VSLPMMKLSCVSGLRRLISAEGIVGVGLARAAHLDIRGLQVRVVRDGELDHLPAIASWGEVFRLLVRRVVIGYEEHFARDRT